MSVCGGSILGESWSFQNERVGFGGGLYVRGGSTPQPSVSPSPSLCVSLESGMLTATVSANTTSDPPVITVTFSSSIGLPAFANGATVSWVNDKSLFPLATVSPVALPAKVFSISSAGLPLGVPVTLVIHIPGGCAPASVIVTVPCPVAQLPVEGVGTLLVKINAPVSYVSASLAGFIPSFPTALPSWCGDLLHTINVNTTYSARLVSVYDPGFAQLFSIARPKIQLQNVCAISYLLNNAARYLARTSTPLTTFGDVQTAIWWLLNGIGSSHSSAPYTAANRDFILQDVLLNAPTYVPWAPTDLYAFFVLPLTVLPSMAAVMAQVTIVPVSVAQLKPFLSRPCPETVACAPCLLPPL